jgi:hypothetical protein
MICRGLFVRAGPSSALSSVKVETAVSEDRRPLRIANRLRVWCDRRFQFFGFSSTGNLIPNWSRYVACLDGS